MDTLSQVSGRFHAPVLDLNRESPFLDSDFSDTCHMRASGGKKLLDLVSAAMAKDPQIIRALKDSKAASKLATFGRTIY
jgi:hypothetical protein